MSKRRAAKPPSEDFVEAFNTDDEDCEQNKKPAAAQGKQRSDVEQEPGSDADNTETDAELQLVTPAKRAPKKQEASTPRQELAAAAAAAPARAAGEPWQDEAGWTIAQPSIIFRTFGFVAPSVKIAAFDLDATLVNRKTNAEFPRKPDDWKWWNKGVPSKLAGLVAQGFKIVIFNNQPNIKANLFGKQKEIMQEQIAQIHANIPAMNGGQAVPLQVFLAPSNKSGDPCTKPATGMWNYMVQHCNGGLQPDLSQSFMVGDEDCDSAFAVAIGVPYHKPEEFFGAMDGKPRIDYKLVNAAKAGIASGTAPNTDLITQLRTLAEHTLSIRVNVPHGKGPFESEGLKWKAFAYRKAADALLPQALSTLPAEITQANMHSVGDLKGVGKETIKRVALYVQTGSIRTEEDEKADEAAGVAPAYDQAAGGPAYAYM